jgi:hypothetical protein
MRRLRTSLLLAFTAVLVSASLKSAAADGGGFVICSCQLCSQSDVVCRISPSGFSIACADYYKTHCK